MILMANSVKDEIIGTTLYTDLPNDQGGRIAMKVLESPAEIAQKVREARVNLELSGATRH